MIEMSNMDELEFNCYNKDAEVNQFKGSVK